MMRRTTILFLVALTILFGGGLLLGHGISLRPQLQPFKLLNILGLSYDVLGLIVLSEVVSKSERWKSIVVNWIAGILIWGQMVIPLGAALGSWLSEDAPSGAIAAAFFGAVFTYSILPLAILDATVFYPTQPELQHMQGRVRRFGFLLLLSGGLVQLLAALIDFHGERAA